jgi:hypothetical protein
MQPQGIPVNIEQLKNRLKLAEAKIEIQDRIIKSHEDLGKQERRLVADFCRSQGFSATEEYAKAHKAHYDARAEQLRVEMAELQSNAMICKALIAEAERQAQSRIVRPS